VSRTLGSSFASCSTSSSFLDVLLVYLGAGFPFSLFSLVWKKKRRERKEGRGKEKGRKRERKERGKGKEEKEKRKSSFPASIVHQFHYITKDVEVHRSRFLTLALAVGSVFFSFFLFLAIGNTDTSILQEKPSQLQLFHFQFRMS
jgi:hypothetical protein